MAPKIESVLLPARLTGMNQCVICAVSAIKVAVAGPDKAKYSRPRIVGAPLDLPDGPYEVTFAGRAQAVQRRKGTWIGLE